MAPNPNNMVEGIYSTLSGDGTLTALLGTYNSATAIFSGPRVPDQTGTPYLWIRPLVAVSGFSGRDFRGLEMTFDIVVAVENTESQLILNNVMSRVITLLDGQDITISTDNFVLCRLNGTQTLPNDGELTGLAMQFEFIVT
jgi:hypothetical protein